MKLHVYIDIDASRVKKHIYIYCEQMLTEAQVQRIISVLRAIWPKFRPPVITRNTPNASVIKMLCPLTNTEDAATARTVGSQLQHSLQGAYITYARPR